MADLSPDLSPYKAIAGQGQANQFSLPQLLQITGAARGLQNQAAIGQAIQENPDDPGAALKSAIARSPYLGPEDITSFTHAQEAQSRLQQFYTGEAMKTAGMLWAKAISPQGADHRDWDIFKPILRGYNVPSSVISDVESRLIRPDGKVDPDVAAEFRQLVGGAAEPQQAGMTETGRQISFPAATTPFGGVAGGAGAGRGITTTQTPVGAATGAGAAHDYAADTKASREFTSDVTPLRHVIDGIQKGVLTGRGTEEMANFGNFIHTMGVDSLFGVDLSKKVAGYEEMRKYMIRAADMASAGGTNDRLAAAVAGNPNAKLTSLSNEDLAKVNLALRRMQQVGYQEFNDQIRAKVPFHGVPLTPEDYGKWFAEWAPKQDSRAFVHDLMNDKQKDAVFSRMTKDSTGKSAEMDSYRASLKAMRNHPEIEQAGAP